MGMFDKFFKKNGDIETFAKYINGASSKTEEPKVEEPKIEACTENPASNSDDMLADYTYIRDMKCIVNGPWHQYDVMIAARGYGWDTMISWADYMVTADFSSIDQVTAGDLGRESELTEAFHANDNKILGMKEIETEQGALSIAGNSISLKAPMKIVWFNQTQLLRFFTILPDEDRIRRYAETVIRRTFGTPDAFKLGIPLEAK